MSVSSHSTSLSPWASGSRVVVVVYCTSSRSTLGIPRGWCGALSSISSSARTDSRVVVVRQDFTAVVEVLLMIALRQGRVFVLLERRQTNLTLSLSRFPISLGLDSVQSNLFHIACIHIGLVPSLILVPRSPTDATPPKAIEAPSKEQTNPSGKFQPESHANGRTGPVNSVYTRFCEEEEGDVEDEGEHGDGCCETADTGATAGHGHFADVGEETEDRGDGCED